MLNTTLCELRDPEKVELGIPSKGRDKEDATSHFQTEYNNTWQSYQLH